MIPTCLVPLKFSSIVIPQGNKIKKITKPRELVFNKHYSLTNNQPYQDISHLKKVSFLFTTDLFQDLSGLQSKEHHYKHKFLLHPSDNSNKRAQSSFSFLYKLLKDYFKCDSFNMVSWMMALYMLECLL